MDELSGGNLKSFNAQMPAVANQFTGMYLLDTASEKSYSDLKIFTLDLCSVVETHSLEWLWQNIWGKEIVAESITSGLIAAQILAASKRELLQFWTKMTFGQCLEDEKRHPSLADLKLAPKQTLASGFQCKAVGSVDFSSNFISRSESGKFQCWSKNIIKEAYAEFYTFRPSGFKEAQASRAKEAKTKSQKTLAAD